MKFSSVILLVLAAVSGYVWSVEVRIARIAAQEVETVTTKWVSGGITRECTTLRDPGETDALWRKRHFAAVTDAQTQYPPD